MKEKLLRKKLERQAEEAKKDVKLEDFSDEEYDTHRRFQGTHFRKLQIFLKEKKFLKYFFHVCIKFKIKKNKLNTRRLCNVRWVVVVEHQRQRIDVVLLLRHRDERKRKLSRRRRNDIAPRGKLLLRHHKNAIEGMLLIIFMSN